MDGGQPRIHSKPLSKTNKSEGRLNNPVLYQLEIINFLHNQESDVPS